MKEEYTVGAPMPRSIGLCADLYSEVRELRLAMQKHTDTVKERETEIREYIINNLSKSDDTGAAGKRYRAQIVRKVVPSVTDWTKLWDYVKKTGRFDLLQKRVSDTAVKDSWETGNEIPGVDRFHAVEVSITKL